MADFTFHIWLDPLRLAAVRDTAVFVRAPDHIRTWVRDRYAAQLQAAVRRGFRPDATVEVVARGLGARPRRRPAPRRPARPERRQLLAKYTFEQFVIGRGNRFAHAAALAVAEQPGHAYNPLFIHGRPGLGKTHLLHAVGNYIARHEPGMQVRYATVEEFTNEFVRAIQARDMAAFKNSFREVDVLLLDDVQFLAEKARTEEELFHTFNALRDSGKQLVMTSDRPPDELQSLEQRLGERFGSGLVVSSTRRTSTSAAPSSRSAPAWTTSRRTPPYRGDRRSRSTSVRALEAALIQVVAYASLRDEPPTPELARRLLKRIGARPPDPAASPPSSRPPPRPSRSPRAARGA